MRLAGKIAAVTGSAGNGIGRAIALAFAREGADVAVLDIRPAAETLALVKTTGRRAAGAPLTSGPPSKRSPDSSRSARPSVLSTFS
ncbi:MAG TPA: SDR family NAD(P)-dependent oxidoreductase [bacterium]|nr:SDR family NAD(P)-dependent oxidoreductase [bacterium]